MPDGQIIWLEMQLTELQLRHQLDRFRKQQSGRPVMLEVERGSPDSVVELVTDAAADMDLEVIVTRR
jgi:hypothetical protein